MELTSNNSILFIKLKTGEELLAEVPDEDKDSPVIHLKNPMELVTFDDNSTGQTGFSFREWIPRAFIDDDVLSLKVSDTYVVTTPTPALVRFYAKVITPKKTGPKVIQDDPAVTVIDGNDISAADAGADFEGAEDMTATEMFAELLRNMPKSTIH